MSYSVTTKVLLSLLVSSVRPTRRAAIDDASMEIPHPIFKDLTRLTICNKIVRYSFILCKKTRILCCKVGAILSPNLF